jgi:hypothetical protein
MKLFALLLVASNLLSAHCAFIHNSRSPAVRSFSFGPIYETSTEEDEPSKGSVTLNLKGETSVKTKPLQPSAPEKLFEFLRLDEHRNLLVTAGGTRPKEVVEPTPELLEQWKKACDVVGSSYPSGNDEILKVKTGGVSFPGLTVTSIANIGSKFLVDPESAKPFYEFTLVGDEQIVTGLAPIVWIFNQLTGAGKKDGKEGTSTSSLSRVTYEQSDDDKIVFKIDSSLRVDVKFPAILLKILPTSKEQTEATGGSSLVKALEKDVVKSMSALESAYEKWIS